MKLWFINIREVGKYDGERSAPRIYEIEAEERFDYYELDKTNPNCYAGSVSKSEMRTNFNIFFTTEEEAKQGFIDLCKRYASCARERAKQDNKIAAALEGLLFEMKEKGVCTQ